MAKDSEAPVLLAAAGIALVDPEGTVTPESQAATGESQLMSATELEVIKVQLMSCMAGRWYLELVKNQLGVFASATNSVSSRFSTQPEINRLKAMGAGGRGSHGNGADWKQEAKDTTLAALIHRHTAGWKQEAMDRQLEALNRKRGGMCKHKGGKADDKKHSKKVDAEWLRK